MSCSWNSKVVGRLEKAADTVKDVTQ